MLDDKGYAKREMGILGLPEVQDRGAVPVMVASRAA